MALRSNLQISISGGGYFTQKTICKYNTNRKILTINKINNILFCNFTPTPYFRNIYSAKTEEKTPLIEVQAIIIYP